jgi:hypothetical protein
MQIYFWQQHCMYKDLKTLLHPGGIRTQDFLEADAMTTMAIYSLFVFRFT